MRFPTALAVTALVLALTVPAPAQDAAVRRRSTASLKQVGLAMHNYHADFGWLPADIVDKNGKALLSWRVAILPYIEQDDLYKQFMLKEPWDSEHNKKLVGKIPKVFVSPAQNSKEGTTTYLGPVGDGLVFSAKVKGQGTRIRDIKDGTSNTIMLFEATDGRAVEWTRPGDLAPDAKNPAKDLIGHYPEGFLAVMCDGSVKYIKKNTDAKTINAALTIAGGETVTIP